MKPPVQHPPYLDASTRAAGEKHGGNETIHTQPNPTLPNKLFLCFTQIPTTACLFLNICEVCFQLVDLFYGVS